jgi:putative transposase
MEAYVHRVSTRLVDDLVQGLGIDTGISKSEVSRICAGLDEAVTAFRSRTLGHTRFPYVYLDATYVHVRDSPRVVVSGAGGPSWLYWTCGPAPSLGTDLFRHFLTHSKSKHI